MPKLPNQRRVYTQDFSSEYQDLIQKLSESLNINLEVLYDALNKKVTLSDNIACTVRTIEIEVDGNGIPTSNISLALDNKQPILGTQVLSAINLTNSGTYPTGQPFISYSLNSQGRLVINHISGLQANNKYRLNLIVWN